MGTLKVVMPIERLQPRLSCRNTRISPKRAKKGKCLSHKITQIPVFLTILRWSKMASQAENDYTYLESFLHNCKMELARHGALRDDK